MANADRYIKLAAKNINNDSNNKVNMVAIIVKGGRVLSIGHNNMKKSHSVFFNGSHCKAVHAEFAAIREAKYTKDANMYVFRLLKRGGIGISKPCSDCMDLIRDKGIRNITYYDGTKIITERVHA